MSGLSWLDVMYMQASQPFNMTPATGQLNWVGPAINGQGTGLQTWMPKGDGVVIPGEYMWRFRFWVGTAPGATGNKLAVSLSQVVSLACARVFNVDDLNTFTAYRPGFEVVQSYSKDDLPILPPLISYGLASPDATGVLRYDMAVWRIK